MTTRSALLLAALSLSGCSSPPPDVYAVPIAVAYEKLRAGSLKDFRYARQCGILIDITSEGVPDKSVRWVVTSSGLNVASWTARLAAVDADHTRITIEVPAALLAQKGVVLRLYVASDNKATVFLNGKPIDATKVAG